MRGKVRNEKDALCTVSKQTENERTEVRSGEGGGSRRELEGTR